MPSAANIRETGTPGQPNIYLLNPEYQQTLDPEIQATILRLYNEYRSDTHGGNCISYSLKLKELLRTNCKILFFFFKRPPGDPISDPFGHVCNELDGEIVCDITIDQKPFRRNSANTGPIISSRESYIEYMKSLGYQTINNGEIPV